MRKRVLVCDDEPELRRALRLLLEKDYDVAEASRGDEALGAIAQKPPHLVLLDVTMPGMTGLETLRRIHEARPDVRVIMLTTHKEIGIARRCLEAGASQYMTKPFDADDLVKLAGELLGEAGKKDASGRPWRVVAGPDRGGAS